MIRKVTIWVLALLLTAGCGSDGESFVSTTTPPSQETGPPALEVETVSARVVLPAGSPLTLDSLEMMTPLGKANPNAEGSFEIQKFEGGSQLVLVLDQEGDPVLLGWLNDGSTIDINSTANILLFFSLGSSHLPAELRVPLETLISDLPQADTLAQNLAQLHQQNTKFLAVENPEVKEALQEAVQSIIESQALGRILSDPNPSTLQSGVRLNINKSANQISLTQTFRRRAHAFVKRVSYVDQQDNVIPAPLLVTEIPLPPTGGLTSLTAGLTDAGIILLGYQDGNQLAYTEQTHGEVNLRTIDGSKETKFEVVVVGPGDLPGDLNRLTAEEVKVHQEVTLKFVVGDLALQVFFNILLPNSSDYAPKLQALLGDGANTVIGDLINTAKALNPQIADKALRGDIVGSLAGAYDLIINSGTFRQAVIAFFAEFFFNANETDEFFDKAAGAMKVTGAVDLALSTFDTAAIGKAIIDSHMAETWDLRVLPPDILLRPENPVIVQGDKKTFTVTVPEVDSGVPLVYKWSNTAAYGELSDGQPQHKNNFDSTLNSVTYTAGNTSGQDTVTVEVFEVVEPGVGGSRKSLGTASTTIAVESIVVEPASVILSTDDSQEFKVVVPESIRENATYQWDLSSDTGTLSSLTESQTTYSVRDTVVAPASDTITVDVMVNGQPFGSATASITISDVDILINPTSASLEPGTSESFSALAVGIPVGETAVYEWESVNGFGTLSAPMSQNTDYIVLNSITPPLDDTLRLRVYSEDSQGNRTLQGMRDVPIGIVGSLRLSDTEFASTPDATITIDNRILVSWTGGSSADSRNVFYSSTSLNGFNSDSAASVGPGIPVNTTPLGGLSKLGILPDGSGYIGWQAIENISGSFALKAPYLRAIDSVGNLGTSVAVGVEDELILDLAPNASSVFTALTTSSSPDYQVDFHRVTSGPNLSAEIGSGTTFTVGSTSFQSAAANETHIVFVTSSVDVASTREVRGTIVELATGASSDFLIDDDTAGFSSRNGVDLILSGAISWSDGGDIFVRTFQTDGSLDTPFSVTNDGYSNDFQDRLDTASSLALDPTTGDIIVAWSRVDAGKTNIFVQRFGSNGQALSQRFQVNKVTGRRESEPLIIMKSDGNFAVVWSSATPETGPATSSAIYGSLFTSSGP